MLSSLHALHALQSQHAALTADYMSSKADVTAATSQLKNVTRHVSKLTNTTPYPHLYEITTTATIMQYYDDARCIIDEAPAAVVAVAVEILRKEEEEEEEEGGIDLDNMCLAETDGSASLTPVFRFNSASKSPDPNIPASYVGKTPLQLLQPPHKPPTVSSAGVMTFENTVIEPPVHNTTVHVPASLRNYAATAALYKLHGPSSDAPRDLHLLLPRFYRELWGAWAREYEEEKEKEERVRKETTIWVDAVIEEVVDGLVVVEEKVEETADDVDVAAAVDERAPKSGKRSGGAPKPLRATPPEIEKHQAILPCAKVHDEIVQKCFNNQLMIIHGATGCGKTTQIPQFILKELRRVKVRGNILCCQPRRLATMSVADRVKEELGGDSIVGYTIRGLSTVRSNTEITFCTTGIVNAMLKEDPDLQDVNFIIVDEVHERSVHVDLLLTHLRGLIARGARKDLRIVLMSATIDAELFATYFQPVLSAPPPFVTIPGRAFPVDCLYLEDLMERTDTHIERGSMYAKRSVRGGGTTQLKLKDKDGVKQSQTFDLYDDDEAYKDSIDVDDVYRGYGDRTRVSMWRVDESTINYDLIVTVVGSLVDKFSAGDGAVLIFLPGMAEIKKLNGMLTAFGDLHVLPLHSSLPPAANKEAFKSAPRGKRKVILSTNIAETSITISDVVVVVDTGLEREISMDRRGISRLMVKWCSRSSVKQRQGRAGRVQQGLCLKLFSRHTYLHKMNENTVPELQRVPIGEVCMQVLGGASGEGEEIDCSKFLSNAPQPPKQEQVDAAIKELTSVGAVVTNLKSRKQSLTKLGLHLSKLGVEVRVGKVLLYSTLFECVERGLTVAAVMSIGKSLFQSDFEGAGGAERKAALRKFEVEGSDFLTACKVYEAFKAKSGAWKWCKDNWISRSVLVEIDDLRDFMKRALSNEGWLDSPTINSNNDAHSVVHAAVCAGLWGNFARWSRIDGVFWGKDKVALHGGGVLGKNEAAGSNWKERMVVWGELFSGERNRYVGMCAVVNPLLLVLGLGGSGADGGGEVAVKGLADGGVEVRVCGVEVQCSARIAMCLRALGEQLRLEIEQVWKAGKARKKGELGEAGKLVMKLVKHS